MTPTMTLMAVKHYDPRYFSQSGRVEQELELYEGDIVRPLGTFIRLHHHVTCHVLSPDTSEHTPSRLHVSSRPVLDFPTPGEWKTELT